MGGFYRGQTQLTDEEESEDADQPLWRQRLRRLVHCSQFEVFFAVLIVTNSVLIGIEADVLARSRQEQAPRVFFVLGSIYNLIFFLELMLRMLAEGKRYLECEKWLWNSLDVLIVLGSVLEMSLEAVTLAAQSSGKDVHNISNMRIVRLIRLTRLLRAFRLPRIIRFISALRTLVYSIAVTLKSLMWAMLLLLLITYVFAIVFAQAVNSYLVRLEEAGTPLSETDHMLEHFWGNLIISMTSLFKSISGGIDWHEAVGPLGAVSFVWQVWFYVFICFTYFAVLNVVTGVFCNSAIETAQNDPDMMSIALLEARRKYMRSIQKVFSTMDLDKNGSISIQEFEHHIQQESAQAYLAAMDIDVNDAWMLFKLLDTDGTNVIEFDEFVDGCLRLRGTAKGVDVAKVIYDHKSMQRKLNKILHMVGERMSDSEARPSTAFSDSERPPISLGDPIPHDSSTRRRPSVWARKSFHR